MKLNNSKLSTKLSWKKAPWYALLFAIYPTLALLAHNITEVSPNVAVIPLMVSIIGAMILLLLSYGLVHNWQRAALVTTILLALFFLYGHAYSSLKGITISGHFIFRHRTLAPLFLIVVGLGAWWACRKRLNVQKLTPVLNVASLLLIIMPTAQIATGLFIQWNAWREAEQMISGSEFGETVVSVTETPDIYYIILDTYERADKIQELYDYNNSEFINWLEDHGFYVANCSLSNYAQTELSLSSSLNFNYLDALNDTLTSGNADRSPLWPLIKHSAIRQFLEARGYVTIAFATGFNWSEVNDADIYFTPQVGTWELNSFQYMLIQTTAGRILLDAEELNLPNTPDDLTRRRTLYALEKLQVIPSIDGPKFVFAHLLVPHTFVFGPNGEEIYIDKSTMTEDIFRQGYIDQIIFINKQIEAVVTTLITNSPTPPIIIIQGDHGTEGSTWANRMSILNAVYLPGHEGMLYSTITPVNTFRIILNTYFGQNLPLLPDVSLHSGYQNPYEYHEIENECGR